MADGSYVPGKNHSNHKVDPGKEKKMAIRNEVKKYLFRLAFYLFPREENISSLFLVWVFSPIFISKLVSHRIIKINVQCTG